MVILHGRSIDDILSAFAYKPHRQFPNNNDDDDNQAPPPPPPPPPRSPPPPKAFSLTRSGRRRGNNGQITSRRGGDYKPKEAEEEGPNTPPLRQPPLLKNKRRKTTTPASLTSTSPSCASSSSFPSSFIRATVGGKPVMVSRFFPLPPQTSSPVVTDSKVPKVRKPKASGNSVPSRSGDDEKKKTTKKKRNCCTGENPNDEEEEQRGQQLKKRSRMGKQPIAQLSAVEKKSDAYRRVPANSVWEPPESCHHLLQERHSFDPWRVLIICMLLNVTTGRQVEKILPGLFLLCPDAETTTRVPEEEIEKVIQTLGLQKKRARMIKQFSCEYLRNDWTHVTQLHGIGKYAADAYAIFCVGKPEQVVPQDHKLLDYWKFVCGNSETK